MTRNSHFDFEASVEPPGQRIRTALTKISLALKNQVRNEAGALRLSPTQGQILAFLRSCPNHGATLTAIAQAIAITPGTASTAVRTLEKQGLVRKVRSKHDARFVTMTLSAKGQRVAEQTASCPDFLTEVAEAFSSAEEEVFLRTLIRIVRTLQERGEVPATQMCVTCRYFRPNVHSDPQQPHHCDLADMPFGDRLLRMECPMHEQATAEKRERNWNNFVRTGT